jgi:hypothetical protein
VEAASTEFGSILSCFDQLKESRGHHMSPPGYVISNVPGGRGVAVISDPGSPTGRRGPGEMTGSDVLPG